MTTSDRAVALLRSTAAPGLLVSREPAGTRVVASNAAADALLGSVEGLYEPVLAAITAGADAGRTGASVTWSAHRLDDRTLVVWLQDGTAADQSVRADRDPLTGLPGVGYLGRVLRELAGREGLALVGVDLSCPDGSPLPDPSLAEAGRWLAQPLRGADVVTHRGGGRFALVLTDAANLGDLTAFRQRLERSLHLTLADDRPVVTVAALVDPAGTASVEDLLVELDGLMGEAAVAARPVIVGTVHHGDASGSPITAEAFRQALTDGQLRLHYQPVVDVRDGRAAGAEALLRWRHPDLGVLAPREFLDVVESDDDAVALGRWVTERAVAQAAAWDRRTDLTYYRIGINISPRHLFADDVVAHVSDLLAQYRVSGERFAIEITESEELSRRSEAHRAISRLRDLGLRVAIDDFGSGFANLSALRDFPVDLVKVDRALVSTVPTPHETSILAAVCSIAAAIGADVLLEGVEREDQLTVARATGVTFAQGLLVGPPVAPGDLPPQPRWPLSSNGSGVPGPRGRG